jgi:hypothetical protein
MILRQRGSPQLGSRGHLEADLVRDVQGIGKGSLLHRGKGVPFLGKGTWLTRKRRLPSSDEDEA